MTTGGPVEPTTRTWGTERGDVGWRPAEVLCQCHGGSESESEDAMKCAAQSRMPASIEEFNKAKCMYAARCAPATRDQVPASESSTDSDATRTAQRQGQGRCDCCALLLMISQSHELTRSARAAPSAP